MTMTPSHGQALLRQLGVEVEDVERLHRVPHRDAIKLLNVLKEKVRRNWKKLAFELHPDRTGNDPAKTRLFRDLNTLREKFEQMQVLAPPVTPPPQEVIFVPPTPGVVYGSVRPMAPRGPRTRVGHIAANLKP
jgi:hypothetical protein